jgi:hypothetical protein
VGTEHYSIVGLEPHSIHGFELPSVNGNLVYALGRGWLQHNRAIRLGLEIGVIVLDTYSAQDDLGGRVACLSPNVDLVRLSQIILDLPIQHWILVKVNNMRLSLDLSCLGF